MDSSSSKKVGKDRRDSEGSSPGEGKKRQSQLRRAFERVRFRDQPRHNASPKDEAQHGAGTKSLASSEVSSDPGMETPSTSTLQGDAFSLLSGFTPDVSAPEGVRTPRSSVSGQQDAKYLSETDPSSIASKSSANAPITFKIRVITPQIARRTAVLNFIPPLSQEFTAESLLRELKHVTMVHLERPIAQNKPSEETDIYIADHLIETSNYDFAVSELGILELLVNGVLDLYAVTRPLDSETVPNEQKGTGKEEIFSLRSHWMVSPSQSRRGISAFLSSLRVFSHIITSREMTTVRQESIMRVIYSFTRFFPIMKAFRTLMSDKTLSAPESAIIVQCCLELLRDIIPPEIINKDNTRLLEGSRLLFGYILEAAKTISLDDSSPLPLMDAFKTVDLCDMKTSNPVKNPVFTEFGLLDMSTLSSLPDVTIIPTSSNVVNRIVKLTDGKYAEYSYFDFDEVKSFIGNHARTDIDRRVIRDAHYLSGLCETNKFVVTLPSDLAKATAPCLTFDAIGDLGVYTGRAPCAAPGKDFQVFRPVLRAEMVIDTAMVTQELQPILEHRKTTGDSGIIFDAIGLSVNRKQNDPDELVMLVVDCSYSMNSSSDFHDKDEFVPPKSQDSSNNEADVEAMLQLQDPLSQLTDEEEALTLLRSHESFEDMVAIIRANAKPRWEQKATEILDYICDITKQEIKSVIEKQNEIKEKYTVQLVDFYLKPNKLILINLIAKFQKITEQKQLLAKYLVEMATQASKTPMETWAWAVGEKSPKKAQSIRPPPKISVSFDPIPEDLLCSITQSIFRDPVIAADGTTYDRRAIERWFQIEGSSPTTGQKIAHKGLRSNAKLDRAVKSWVNAEDVTDQVVSVGAEDKKYGCYVTFQLSPGNISFRRFVSKAARIEIMYKIAYRGLRGEEDNFYLSLDGTLLVPEQSSEASENFEKSSANPYSDGYVDLYEGAKIVIKKHQEGVFSGFSDVRLFKVYHLTKFEFAYWVESIAMPTVSSIIFKRWRWYTETRGSINFKHQCLEGEKKMMGDRWYAPFVHQPWDRFEVHGYSEYYAWGCFQRDDDFTSTVPRVSDLSDPVVFKVNITDPKPKETKRPPVLTRMDVCQQIFSSFVNRTLAYNYANHYGLITFESSVKVEQELTYVMEDFRGKVMQMKPSGDTALWDALNKAVEELKVHAKKFPKARKRIICLSDGADTNSKTSAVSVQLAARENAIIIDSFCVGDTNYANNDLMMASHNTGGYKFKPRSLEEAMDLGEMEPVLSISARSENVRPPNTIWLSWGLKPDYHPKLRVHKNMHDEFFRVSAASTSSRKPQVDQSTTNKPGVIRNSRILSEIRKVAGSPHPFYDIFVSESNMGFWKIVFQGPPDSAYSTGAFVLYLNMGDDYPFFPPEARFITEILHPNINKHGRVCHSILDRNWTSDTSNVQLLNMIWSLLSVPEASDPVSTVITLDYHWDEVAFRERVKNHICMHAKKTREQLVRDIEGWETWP
ncbi:hypothetical protein TWF694_011376 [Orbilia ellipsospora]|uniref:peptidylprolyl isomerase n=1 Tax=Orbilia ellipsospora TaxID=2528407 RepID=A0AAV9X7N2_9PEZI